MKKLIFSLVLFINFFSFSVLFADQNNSRLDYLFSQLSQIKSEIAADIILAEIWSIWSKTDNEMAQVIFDDGNQLMSKGQFEESILTFTEVIALQPDFAEAWNKRATVYFFNGEFEKSIQDIEKTLSLEPRHFGALDGLAQIYFLQDKFLKAAATYEQLLQILPFSENAKRQLERINGQFI